ncbi:hypothetical protein D3C71_1213660 [compost metagenome]
MVHADVLVAGCGQALHRQAEQRELVFRRRHAAFVDLPLCSKQVWQVRIAVHSQSIRAQRQHQFQGTAEALKALPGQAVDQIDVDRTHAAVAARAQDVQRLPHALHAVDRFLHLRVEILHTQAGAIEAEPGQHRHVAGIDETRVQFDGKITLR